MVWSSGGVPQVWRYGGLEARRRLRDVGGEKAWRPGGALGGWRHGGIEALTHVSCSDMKVWRHGTLEACCKCGDMEVWSCGALETGEKIRAQQGK